MFASIPTFVVRMAMKFLGVGGAGASVCSAVELSMEIFRPFVSSQVNHIKGSVTDMSEVEHFQAYSKTVQSIPEAFTFVMEYLDNATEPRIEISPCWYYEEEGPELWYEVNISWSQKTSEEETEEAPI